MITGRDLWIAWNPPELEETPAGPVPTYEAKPVKRPPRAVRFVLRGVALFGVIWWLSAFFVALAAGWR